MTSWPSFRSPRTTSVKVPSLRPSVSWAGAGPPVGAEKPGAAGDAPRPAVVRSARQLVVAALLFRREDLADPHAGRVADLLRPRAPVGLRQSRGLERHELLATVLEDRLELLLLD